MLHSIWSLTGRRVEAWNGDAGKVADFLFDDQTWTIRCLVVEVGGWLHHRRVAIPSFSVGAISPGEAPVPVGLSIRQVRECAGLHCTSAAPEFLRRALERCRLLPYRLVPRLAGTEPTMMPPESLDIRFGGSYRTTLRSAREVASYNVMGYDGEVGVAFDLVVDDVSWAVRHVLLQNGDWPVAQTSSLAPYYVEGISWTDRHIHTAVSRRDLRWERAGSEEIVSRLNDETRPGAGRRAHRDQRDGFAADSSELLP